MRTSGGAACIFFPPPLDSTQIPQVSRCHRLHMYGGRSALEAASAAWRLGF